jgi:hypothetical protein
MAIRFLQLTIPALAVWNAGHKCRRNEGAAALRSLVLSEMPSDIFDRFNGSRAEMGLHRVEPFPMYRQFLRHKS